MGDDSSLDTSSPPSDFSIASEVPADASGAVATDTLMVFQFCVLYAGKPWQTLPLAAPSPELAADTMNQIIMRVNARLVDMHYPPAASWRSGEC